MSNDEEGDSLNGTIDLSEIRAFVNNEYLYIMVAYYQDGPFDHMIFRIGEEDGNGRTLNIWPGEYSQYENAPGENFEEFNAISAQGDVIEIKVPLVDLGIVPFAIHRLETYCGKTASCDRGDGIDGDNIIAVDEIEETAVLAVQIEATSTPAIFHPQTFRPTWNLLQLKHQYLPRLSLMAIRMTGMITMFSPLTRQGTRLRECWISLR